MVYSQKQGVSLVIINICIYYVLQNSNSVDPDQMMCSVASDLDLHCANYPFAHLQV